MSKNIGYKKIKMNIKDFINILHKLGKQFSTVNEANWRF